MPHVIENCCVNPLLFERFRNALFGHLFTVRKRRMLITTGDADDDYESTTSTMNWKLKIRLGSFSNVCCESNS